MAVASGEPMKIGRKRVPSSSRRSTIGWLVGTSTRTPISDRRITAPPFGRWSRYHRSGTVLPGNLGPVAVELAGGHSPFLTRARELATILDRLARS